jgi:hypothetical protein
MNTQPKFLARATPLAQVAIDALRHVAQTHGLEVATRVVAEPIRKPFTAEQERAFNRRRSLPWLAGLLGRRSRRDVLPADMVPGVDPVHPKPTV